MTRENRKHHWPWLIKGLKLLVFALSLWLLYSEIWQNERFWTYLSDLKSRPNAVHWPLFILGVMLVVVNWGCEALKWKLLIAQYQKMTFFQAFRAILAGVFIGFFTPNRLGEFAGRLVYITKPKKLEGALLTMAGNLAQNLCTFLLGLAALIFLYDTNPWPLVSWITLIVSSIALLFLYFNLDRVVWLLLYFKVPKKITKHFIALRRLDNTILLQVLSLSLLRYAVFSLQYFLFFQAFNVEISLGHTLIAVSAMFLIQSALPSFAVSEVTIRGSVAIKTFAPFIPMEASILLVTYSIWLINILFPALFGGLLFLLNKKKDVGI